MIEFVKRMLGLATCTGCIYRRLWGLRCGCPRKLVPGLKRSAWSRFGCWYYVDRKRNKANEQLVKEIAKWVKKFPDWRFHQILQNMGVSNAGVDHWNEESDTTLNRVKREADRWGRLYDPSLKVETKGN